MRIKPFPRVALFSLLLLFPTGFLSAQNLEEKLEAKIKHLENIIDKEKANIDYLRREFLIIKKEKETLFLLLKEKEEVLNKLRSNKSNCSDRQEELNYLKQQGASLKEELINLKGAKSKLEIEVSLEREQFMSMVGQKDKTIKQLSQQAASAKKEIESKEEQLKEKCPDVNRYKKEIEGLNKEISAKEKELTYLKEQLNKKYSISEEIKARDEEIKKLKQIINGTIERIDKLSGYTNATY